MAVRDGERYLGEALDSILEQDPVGLEVIVVDDGSHDGSAALAERYADRDARVSVERLAPGRGLAVALQHGLERARGAVVVRLDADDVDMPGRIETQVAYLESHPAVVLVGGAYELIDDAGGHLRTVHGPTDPRELRWWLLFGNVFCHSTVAFRRDAALAVGGYRAEITLGEDYDLWVRLAARGAIAMLDVVVARRRIHDRNLSANAPAALREHYVRTVAASIERYSGTAISLEAARWLAAETSVLPDTRRGVPEAIQTISRCLDRATGEGWGRVAVPLAVLELARVVRRARLGPRGASQLLRAAAWAVRSAPDVVVDARYLGAVVSLTAAISGRDGERMLEEARPA